jgi:two-component system CheB/CheR fusion protein
MTHREQVVIEDIYVDARVPHDAYRPTFVKSLVMTPVRRDDPVAAIGVYWRSQRFPTNAELNLLQTLADSVAVALDRAQLFESEQRSREQAEGCVRTQQELLSIVSHDLRNPLNVITMNAQRLKRLGTERNDDRIQKQSEMILRSAGRMERLIHQLLDFARIQAGVFTIATQPQKVGVLLESLQELVPLAREKVQQLVVHPVSDDITVECELDRVVEVLSNLVSNAIKYTPEGGQITVTSAPQEAFVEFAVSDTGEGVPEDLRERLFQRYSRAQKHVEHEGVGLGLSIVKGIVEAHGGRIWVDDPAPGEGATFRFTLPRAPVGEK